MLAYGASYRFNCTWFPVVRQVFRYLTSYLKVLTIFWLLVASSAAKDTAKMREVQLISYRTACERYITLLHYFLRYHCLDGG